MSLDLFKAKCKLFVKKKKIYVTEYNKFTYYY